MPSWADLANSPSISCLLNTPASDDLDNPPMASRPSTRKNPQPAPPLQELSIAVAQQPVAAAPVEQVQETVTAMVNVKAAKKGTAAQGKAKAAQAKGKGKGKGKAKAKAKGKGKENVPAEVQVLEDLCAQTPLSPPASL
ncbi:hypothetical protein CALCODRAFT_481775, partial [Calocera cornea HHB12733]